jgi:hypothetical protein
MARNLNFHSASVKLRLGGSRILAQGTLALTQPIHNLELDRWLSCALIDEAVPMPSIVEVLLP